MQYYKRSNSAYWSMIDARVRKHGSSEIPFHDVTHRDDKSIPGMTEAPRDGIYRPLSAGAAQSENNLRAQRYANDVQMYINGDLPKEHIFREFERPSFGAYGERL